MERRNGITVGTAAAASVRRREKSTFREYAEALLLAIILTVVIRSFVIQAFRIPTGSMEDTLAVGDFLFVNKFLYGAKVPMLEARLPAIRDPQPGDILVFRYPRDPSKDFIKRCVAVEGQTIEIRNKRIYLNGVPQNEPYVKFTDPTIRNGRLDPRDNLAPQKVPPGHVFMVGDNRDNSHDSRYWGFLDRDLIKGKAMFIYWSWDPEHRVFSLIPTPRWSRIGHIIH